MKKRIAWLAAFIMAIMAAFNFCWHPRYAGAPAPPPEAPTKKIVLVPLDGRPPCRQFVIAAGKIAGYDVVVPPPALQDYYSQPGDTAGMRAWLAENIPGAAAVIISVDQLLYGGLLAAREREPSAAERDSLLKFLPALQAANPDVPLYAFSILPRLSPPDIIDGYAERQGLMAYSRLLGRAAAGEDIDEAELLALKEKIPPDSLQKYLSRFSESTALNKELCLLAKRGVFACLVLGQDDGERYSIPNIEKQKLREFIQAQGLGEPQVFLTHGADELALVLLARIANQATGLAPKINVAYNAATTPEHIMPFMAIPLAEAADEKIRLLRGTKAPTPEEADFTLFVSANAKPTLSSRRDSLRRLPELLQHRPVALVDLSEHFQGEEALLPQLIKHAMPLNAFIAYAGWNTASNSLGTALAEASLFLGAAQAAKSQAALLRVCQANLAFLHSRYLEDYFYLKDVIDPINISLKKAGFINTADLDLEHNYLWADYMLRSALGERLKAYRETPAFRQPFAVRGAAGELTLQTDGLAAEASFPWPRTFEISLTATPYVTVLPGKKGE